MPTFCTKSISIVVQKMWQILPIVVVSAEVFNFGISTGMTFTVTKSVWAKRIVRTKVLATIVFRFRPFFEIIRPRVGLYR